MPKRFGHSGFVFAIVALAASFTGCRTASTTLAKVPGFGWMNRGDERWAQYEPAPGLPRPSENTEPTDPGMPNGGVSGLASSDSLRGSTSRSFDEAEKFAKALKDDDRFDGSKYSDSFSADSSGDDDDENSRYASAYGKYGPPKSLDKSLDKLASSSKVKPQSGPYDIDSDSTGDLAANDSKYSGASSKYSSGDAKFAKNGYDLGYESYKGPSSKSPSSKPYPKFGEKDSKSSPYGYVAANSKEPANAKPTSRFDSSRYAPSGSANTSPNSASGSRFAAPETGFAKTANSFANSTSDTASKLGNAANDLANRAQANTNSAIGGLANAANSKFGTARDSLTSAKTQFNNTLNASGNNAKSAVNNAISGASTFKNDVASAAQGATTAAGSSASFNRYSWGTNGAPSQQSGLASAPARAMNSTANSASSSVNSAANTFNSAANSVSNAAKSAYGQFANAANNATSAPTTPPQFGNYNSFNSMPNQSVAQPRSGVNSTVNGLVNSGSNALNTAAAGATSTAQGYGQGLQNAANNALNTAKSALNGNQNAVASTVNGAMSAFGANGQQNVGGATTKRQFNQFTQNALQAAQNKIGNVVGGTQPTNPLTNAPQQVMGQLQNYAQQTQRKTEQAVANTYSQTRQAVENSVASQYQQAKNAAGQYANSAVNNMQNQVGQFAGSVTNSVTNSNAYKNAANAVSNNVQQQFAGTAANAIGNAVNGAMQNVSAPMQSGAYPATTTPNPYVVPGSSIKGAINRFTPPMMGQPSAATTAPAAPPTNYNIPSNNNGGPAFRTATPFLPGSTQSFQGAQTTRKPTVKLASAQSSEAVDGTVQQAVAQSNVPKDEQLVLAVGDQYQFPRTLR